MKSRTSIFPVYLAFLLDSFGLAIIYPVLTPLFLLSDFAIFLPAASQTIKIILLGVAIAAFPLAQLFGAPIIGELSDRIGRKRSFLGTIGGTSLGYLITAFGIYHSSLSLLIVGRLWTGFFAGNLTLCLAAIADLSPDAPSRTKSFGFLASLGGISFILGILTGGSLSGASIAIGTNPSTPFFLMTLLSLINLLLISLFYRDRRPEATLAALQIWKGLHNITLVFKKKKLRNIYLAFFFLMTCWVTSMQFLSAYLLQVYHVDARILLFSLVGVGIIWALTNGILTKQLSYRCKATQVLRYCLPLLGSLLLFSQCTSPLWAFLSIFALCVLCSALAWTNCLSAVSFMAEEQNQGKILGINQSMGALASICGPIIGGLLASFGIHWTYLFASLSCFLALVFIIPEVKEIT